jgi:hypothetical protein
MVSSMGWICAMGDFSTKARQSFMFSFYEDKGYFSG